MTPLMQLWRVPNIPLGMGVPASASQTLSGVRADNRPYVPNYHFVTIDCFDLAWQPDTARLVPAQITS
jgi:hypothetical protein